MKTFVLSLAPAFTCTHLHYSPKILGMKSHHNGRLYSKRSGGNIQQVDHHSSNYYHSSSRSELSPVWFSGLWAAQLLQYSDGISHAPRLHTERRRARFAFGRNRNIFNSIVFRFSHIPTPPHSMGSLNHVLELVPSFNPAAFMLETAA